MASRNFDICHFPPSSLPYGIVPLKKLDFNFPSVAHKHFPPSSALSFSLLRLLSSTHVLLFSAIKLNETKATYFSIPFEKLLLEGFQFEIYIVYVRTKPQFFPSIPLSLLIIIILNEVCFHSVCNYETLANLQFKI